MISIFGPFQILEDSDIEPIRNHTCENYSVCLDLAATLNWDNFTCQHCSGKFNKALTWQALHAQKTDSVAQRICKIPEPFYSKRDKVA